MEAQYYSSKLVSFPLVCYYCGVTEESFVDDDAIKHERNTTTLLPLSVGGQDTICEDANQCQKTPPYRITALYSIENIILKLFIHTTLSDIHFLIKMATK